MADLCSCRVYNYLFLLCFLNGDFSASKVKSKPHPLVRFSGVNDEK